MNSACTSLQTIHIYGKAFFFFFFLHDVTQLCISETLDSGRSAVFRTKNFNSEKADLIGSVEFGCELDW